MPSKLTSRTLSVTALVLAAGESSRFWPLAFRQHKSLFRLGGASILERTVLSLAALGLEKIVIVQSPRSEAISLLPSDCLAKNYGNCQLYFVEQPTAVGQGDAILRSEHLLNDAFLVVQPENMNAGDIAPDLLRAAGEGDLAVVCGYPRPDFQLYAVLETKGNRLIGISEKPEVAPVSDPLCNMGMYFFHRNFIDILAEVPSAPESIIRALEEIARAGKASIAKSRHQFLPLKYPWHLWAYGRYLDLSASGSKEASGDPAAFNVYNKQGTGRYIASEGCVLGDASLNNVIMGPYVVIGSGTRTESGPEHNDLHTVAIGQGATIGAGVVLKPGVRIGAGATVRSGTYVHVDVPEMADAGPQNRPQPGTTRRPSACPEQENYPT